MKFQAFAVSLVVLSSSLESCNAFSSSRKNVRDFQSVTLGSTAEARATESLTNDIISKLQFREAQEKLESLQLDASGTLSAMRERLRTLTTHEGVQSTSVDEEVPTIDQEKLNEVRSL